MSCIDLAELLQMNKRAEDTETEATGMEWDSEVALHSTFELHAVARPNRQLLFGSEANRGLVNAAKASVVALVYSYRRTGSGAADTVAVSASAASGGSADRVHVAVLLLELHSHRILLHVRDLCEIPSAMPPKLTFADSGLHCVDRHGTLYNLAAMRQWLPLPPQPALGLPAGAQPGLSAALAAVEDSSRSRDTPETGGQTSGPSGLQGLQGAASGAPAEPSEHLSSRRDFLLSNTKYSVPFVSSTSSTSSGQAGSSPLFCFLANDSILVASAADKLIACRVGRAGHVGGTSDARLLGMVQTHGHITALCRSPVRSVRPARSSFPTHLPQPTTHERNCCGCGCPCGCGCDCG